jgi:hypothetical protein
VSRARDLRAGENVGAQKGLGFNHDTRVHRVWFTAVSAAGVRLPETGRVRSVFRAMVKNSPKYVSLEFFKPGTESGCRF